VEYADSAGDLHTYAHTIHLPVARREGAQHEGQTINVFVAGGGAAAVGAGATAAGERGVVVRGDVGRDVATGDEHHAQPTSTSKREASVEPETKKTAEIRGILRNEFQVPIAINALTGKFRKFWSELPTDPWTRDVAVDFEYDESLSYYAKPRLFEDTPVCESDVGDVEVFRLSTHSEGATVQMIRAGSAGTETHIQVYTRGRLITPNRFQLLISWLEHLSIAEREPKSRRSKDADTAVLRQHLRRLDAVELETLCLDHFPEVYDKFGRGMRRDELLNLLLDHCRRHPEDADRLAELL
jgi:hypothetical protein